MLKVVNVFPHKYVSGKLLGFADVQFSLDGSDTAQMTWRGFKLFQGKDGGVQIGLPQRKDEKGELDENGKIKYHPVVTIVREEDGGPGNDLLELIRSEVETAYYKLEANGGQAKAKPTKGAGGNSDGIGDDDVPF